MNSSRKVLQVVSRQFSTTVRRTKDEIHPGYPKLWANQKRFQIPDGKPIHLKGGPMDGFLYRATFGIAIFGCLYSIGTLFRLANRKS